MCRREDVDPRRGAGEVRLARHAAATAERTSGTRGLGDRTDAGSGGTRRDGLVGDHSTSTAIPNGTPSSSRAARRWRRDRPSRCRYACCRSWPSSSARRSSSTSRGDGCAYGVGPLPSARSRATARTTSKRSAADRTRYVSQLRAPRLARARREDAPGNPSRGRIRGHESGPKARAETLHRRRLLKRAICFVSPVARLCGVAPLRLRVRLLAPRISPF